MLHRTLERVVRRESGRVLGALIRSFGDFELAQDAFQDAVRQALETWPERGLPENPGAWLTAVSRRKALDRLRRVRVEQRYADESRAEPVLHEPASELYGDERLCLMLTCCHPALSQEAQIALTLQTLGGLTAKEIARAFMVPEATMAQRLVRAKRKIKEARIPFEVPGPDQLDERMQGVLRVVYLIFNEGHLASSGPVLIRKELCTEAIRLGRLLHQLRPDDTEALGLLALMLLLDARRAARFDGGLVELERQDRSRWDRTLIEEGTALLEKALKRRDLGPYQLQAAIAAVHAEAETPEAIDRRQIAVLYDLLHVVEPSPAVALNRAIAWSMVLGPEVGLRWLDRVETEHAKSLGGQLALARAQLLHRAGDVDGARAFFERALQLVENEEVKRFIRRRLRPS